jgi:peroxiredoxin Q/BCP
MSHPTLHAPAPDFTLPDQGGTSHTLSHYQGSYVLIYFYPKDDTPGCTKQACALEELFPAFKNMDAVVLGISTDTVASHAKFAAKYNLTFPLLADEEKKVVEAYGVWGMKKFMGRSYLGTSRTSFLIAPNGTIAKIYENVKPEQHADSVMADLKELKG